MLDLFERFGYANDQTNHDPSQIIYEYYQKYKKKNSKSCKMENEYYGPNVGGYEDDERERAEPGVSNGEENVSGDMGTREILQGQYNHPHC